MKWIEKMVERITRNNAPLNNNFIINQHKIDCQSSTPDFMCVNIDHEHNFSFDFWTKELCSHSGCPYWGDITQEFKKIYENIIVKDNLKINDNE